MKKAFCSWSGGKDSCLALNRAIDFGYEITHLITMFDESGIRSRSHGVSLEVMKAQAESLGIEIITPFASWQDYETVFVETLRELKEKGCDYGIFGDIDLREHREWEEKVCRYAGITAVLPLWGENRLDLVNEFLDEGFSSIIVCINEKYLDKSFCGRKFDEHFISDLPENTDACGENGEFHTFVHDGKIFKNSIPYQIDEIYHYELEIPSNQSNKIYHHETDPPLNESMSFYYAKLSLNDIS